MSKTQRPKKLCILENILLNEINIFMKCNFCSYILILFKNTKKNFF